MNFTDMFDLSYMVLDMLNVYSTYSSHLAFQMKRDRYYSLYMEDLCLRKIHIDIKRKTLELNSPHYSLYDAISEYYPDEAVKESYIESGAWSDKEFVNSIMKKYPKAFKTHHILSKYTKELAKKYNTSIERVIDSFGYAYTRIRWNIDDNDIKDIARLIRKGLEIFREYCTLFGLSNSTTYFSLNYRRKMIRKMRKYLDISKELYAIILKLNSEIDLEYLKLSNYPIMKEYPYIILGLTGGRSGEIIIKILEIENRYNLKIILKDKKVSNRLDQLLTKIGFMKTQDELPTYSIDYPDINRLTEHLEKRILQIIL